MGSKLVLYWELRLPHFLQKSLHCKARLQQTIQSKFWKKDYSFKGHCHSGETNGIKINGVLESASCCSLFISGYLSSSQCIRNVSHAEKNDEIEKSFVW